jgi:hypothetical protein
MTVDVASPDEMFGLQASRPSKWPFLASAFTGSPIDFAAPRSQTERLRMEVCSLLPQRDCCRFSQHSLDSATIFEDRRSSTEFKELFASLTIPGNPSTDVPVRPHSNKGSGIFHAQKKSMRSVPLRLFGNGANRDGSLTAKCSWCESRRPRITRNQEVLGKGPPIPRDAKN